jgi:hypothetical protein
MKLARSLISSLLLILIASPAFAQDSAEDDFVPDSSAPPANRTSGASRGNDATVPDVYILAPANSVGLTTNEQPVIYWYLSKDWDKPVDIGLTATKKIANPVLDTRLKGPMKAGIQRLDLEKVRQNGKPIKLEPGIKYELVITVVASEGADESKNPNAKCGVQLLPPEKKPAAAATEKDHAKRAAIYAKNGVWFDYVDSLNTAIAKNPKDESLLQKRAKSLASQGLIWNKDDGTITEKSSIKKL